MSSNLKRENCERKMSRAKQISWIVIIFTVSVLLRIPTINRPLSKHHEFVTAISLRVLTAWQQESAIEHNFNPTMNFAGSANKWIDNHATSLHKVHDNEGNFYYISHPPLAYILPYAIFEVFGIEASVLSLQLFHLAIHLLSGLLIFQLMREFSSDKRLWLFAFAIYIFLPATLWFQSNTYMSDMLVHFFFVTAVLILVRIWKYSRSFSNLILLGVVSFCMAYTSWLAVFFAATVGGLSLIYRRKLGGLVILPVILGVSVGMALMYTQYSTIAGADVYLEQLFQRFAVRGSNSVEATRSFWFEKFKEIGTILFNYAANYSPLIVLGVLIYFKRKRILITENQSFTFFFLVSSIPVLLLHLVLLNYSGHDFTTLYLSLFLSVSSVLIIQYVDSKTQLMVVVTILILGAANYYVVNRPGEIAQNGDRYDIFLKAGEFIRANADSSEVVFWTDGTIDPMTIIYAKRNVKEVNSIDEAKKWLETVPSKKGIVFERDADGDLVYSRIEN